MHNLFSKKRNLRDDVEQILPDTDKLKYNYLHCDTRNLKHKSQLVPSYDQYKGSECTLYSITGFIKNNDKTYIDKKARTWMSTAANVMLVVVLLLGLIQVKSFIKA